MSTGAGSATDPEPGDEPAPKPKRMKRIARRGVAILLIVVACLLTPLAIASLWVHRTVIDPQGYIDTVAPLSSKPAIQQGLARRTADAVTEVVDGSRLTENLPPAAARRLQPIIEESVRALVEKLALDVVESDRFQELWRAVNEKAHAQVVNLFAGKGDVKIEDGQVVLDLQPVVDRAVKRVRELGIPGVTGQRLEAVDTRFVLIDSEVPGAIQSILELLDHLAYILPFVVLALFGAAVLAAPNHRRGLIWVGIALALTMGLHIAAVGIGRRFYLDVLSGTSVNEQAASDVYDAMSGFLRTSFIVSFFLGLAVALGAFLAGRRTIRELATSLRPVGRSIVVHKRGWRIATVIVGFMVFVLLRRPSFVSFALVAALVIAALIAIEWIVRAQGPPEEAESEKVASSE